VTAALVAVCSLLGLFVGWLLDPLIVLGPQLVKVHGPVSEELHDEARADAIPRVTAPSTTRRALVAITCGVLFGAMGARFEGSWALPAYLVLTAGLVVLAVIDLEHYVLPTRIVHPLSAATLALLALASAGDDDLGALWRAVIAGAIAFALFFLLNFVYPRGMGFGDVRLSFTLGLATGWLGWGEVFVGFFAGFVYGAVVGIALMLVRRRSKQDPVPFGPFLVAGAFTAILLGDAIVTWYLGG
jgi:leader peptidase (prepilin peptidase)/N-methyltransferase